MTQDEQNGNGKNSDEYIGKLVDSGDFNKVEEGLDDEALHNYLVDRIKDITSQETKIITLVGGVASGKTTLAKGLVERLGSADSITTDAFAAGTREYRHTQYGKVENKYDLNLFRDKIEALKQLQDGETLRLPQYDEITGIAAAAGEENFPKIVHKVDYFIIEGDFNFSEGREDLAIYFHVPDEIRTKNRVARDVEQRGWVDTEKLEHDIRVRDEKQHFPFTLPNAEKADILITVSENQGKYSYSIYSKA